MAQPPRVDIFSEDIDVDAAVKTPIPKLPQHKPTIGARQKQWESYKTQIINKKKNKPPMVKKPIPTVPTVKKNNWQPIPPVASPNTPKQVPTNSPKEEKKPVAKIDPPKVPSPVPNQEQNTPQSSVMKGRMPAAAFMNVDQHRKPSWSIPSNSTTHPAYYSYPKGIPKSFLSGEHQQQLQRKQTSFLKPPTGIPKSFLTEEHQQQLQTQQAPFPKPPTGIPRSFLTEKHQQQLQTQPVSFSNPQSAANPPAPEGPVWEAKIPSTKATAMPTWPTNTSYDQSPTGQYDPSQTSQQYDQGGQIYGDSYGISAETFSTGYQAFGQGETYGQSMFVQTDIGQELPSHQYSPSDAYADMEIPDNDDTTGEGSDPQQAGSKRLSAFQRLGPVTQPKKPKLTINLVVDKDQAVREVVDESENPEMDKYLPVLERPDIQTSLDDTVMKYISFWPWKKAPALRFTATARESKAVMQLELEQMDEHYEKEKLFFGISVTGFPTSWSKEDVMDAVLEAVKGKSFIPCFVEFMRYECKFLVIRSRPALVAIHKFGFFHRKDDVLLKLAIQHVNLSVNQIDFLPRLILRKRLSMSMVGDNELNLKEFTLAPDVSHFLYFPLSRVSNQTELMQLQSSVPWHTLTRLVLSHNKIASLSGFNLPSHMPRLRHLDLSYNRIEDMTSLLTLRELPLSSIVLEGNPLCINYIQSERYAKVLKMIFSGLREIDGVKLTLPGDFPPYKRNYSPPEAEEVASKVLDIMFPLLDASPEERRLCEDLYMDDAVLTITFMYKLRYGPIYRDYRALFSHARIMDEGDMDSVQGAPAIANAIHRWPKLAHDPLTFTVDVIYHTETTTILRIGGIVKVTAETLAEDEHLLHFTRTLVLHSLDSTEYKITNEMIYWDVPDKERAMEAFKMTAVRSKNLNLKLEGPPDEELKEKLLKMFMALTELGRKPSERCLESKDWHFRNALEYFAKLLKLDNLDPLYT